MTLPKSASEISILDSRSVNVLMYPGYSSWIGAAGAILYSDRSTGSGSFTIGRSSRSKVLITTSVESVSVDSITSLLVGGWLFIESPTTMHLIPVTINATESIHTMQSMLSTAVIDFIKVQTAFVIFEIAFFISFILITFLFFWDTNPYV